MLKSCLVRLSDNRLFCFYFQAGKGISYRIYENNKWGKEIGLLNKGKENFTANIDRDGVLYIFCQDDMGDIILCSNKYDEWTKKVVLKNQANRIRMVQLNTIFTEKGLCLVYNAPNPEDNGNYIVRQVLDGSGNWSPASRIDRFIRMSDVLFHMHRVTQEHYILYYMMRSNDNSIGYREITPEKHGRYNVFHSTGNVISDSSFLTTNDNIHVLYVVKNMFSAQIFYKKKEADSFSNPIVLAEAQRIDNCLLFYAGGSLYATYIINSQLYYCVSSDSGNTFTRPARYKNKFCLDPIKANYISEPGQNESDFFCRQVYVDSTSLWDVQLMPDLSDNFFPDRNSLPGIGEAMPVPARQQPASTISPNVFDETQFYAPDAENFEDINESSSMLMNRLAMCDEIIAEKDRQIFELTNLMKSRADEMNEIEFERQNEFRKLRSEYDRTLKQLSELEEDYLKLLEENENLSSGRASLGK